VSRLVSGGGSPIAVRVLIADAAGDAFGAAIQSGDVETLQRHLRDNPDLAPARVVDRRGVSRTLLHIVADWPGHFPNVVPT
jgi:hypothetical protein